ncbi:kinase-like domain-containing protein [Mycena latifolia]|nr:kinase-like domain-containing protein [Mycena latifolia]
MSTATNIIPCGGADNVDEGCQEIFPRATPGSLCQKCKKIKAGATAAIQEELMKTLKSCESCGICGPTITNAVCGTCRRKDALEAGGEDPLLAGKQQRLEKIHKSVGMSGRPSPLHDVSNKPFGLSTSISELETLKSASQKGNWTIFITPRRKVVDKSMGNVTKILPGSTSMAMEDALAKIVEQFNLEWIQMPDHGTSMSFELAINDSRYKARLDALNKADEDMDSVMGNGKKRKSSELGSNAGKRAKTGGSAVLTSTFCNDDDLSALSKPETYTIQFETVTCKPQGTDGRQGLCKDHDMKTGQIEVNQLILSARDRGRSKDVYKLSIDGDKQAYVAKKLVDIGQGKGVGINPSDARTLLGRDLVRLTRLATFRDEFFEYARAKGINELADFEISEGFIILVLVSNDPDARDEEPYLVEPLRTSSVVTKFTGTFGSTQDRDKVSATILAFAHFVLQQTACRLAMVDLQGSYHTVNRVRNLVLFDPMTHTIDGKSGTGDHGPEGIRDTIDSHTCNRLCNALGLPSADILIKTLDAHITEHRAAAADSLGALAGYESVLS